MLILILGALWSRAVRGIDENIDLRESQLIHISLRVGRENFKLDLCFHFKSQLPIKAKDVKKC